MKIGDSVLIKKRGESTFQAHGFCKVKNNFTTWVDLTPMPWYPHGEIVKIEEIIDAGIYVKVIDKNGRKWPYPIGFWALHKIDEN